MLGFAFQKPRKNKLKNPQKVPNSKAKNKKSPEKQNQVVGFFPNLFSLVFAGCFNTFRVLWPSFAQKKASRSLTDLMELYKFSRFCHVLFHSYSWSHTCIYIVTNVVSYMKKHIFYCINYVLLSYFFILFLSVLCIVYRGGCCDASLW